MDAWILWLIVVLLLVFIEVITVNLVAIWFIVSALIAMIVSIYVESSLIQFGIFVLGGLILMLLTKPLMQKYLKKEPEALNLDRVIGMTGIVTEEIKKNTIGEVKVDGKKWSAISGSKIEEDTEVIIEKIDGVKLVVRKK